MNIRNKVSGTARPEMCFPVDQPLIVVFLSASPSRKHRDDSFLLVCSVCVATRGPGIREVDVGSESILMSSICYTVVLLGLQLG